MTASVYRKLAGMLRSNLLRPVYHAANAGVRTLKEFISAIIWRSCRDLKPGDDAPESDVPQLGYPCAGETDLCAALSWPVAGQAASAKQAYASARRFTTSSSMRSGMLRQQVRRDLLAGSASTRTSKLLCQITSIGSIPLLAIGAILPGCVPLPHGLVAVGLQRPGHRDAQQRRSSLRR